VTRLRRNPLARAVRIDKLCLAGLEATLRLFRDPERARQEIPVLAMLGMPVSVVGARAEALADALRAAAPDVSCVVEDGTSEVGGGALPLTALPPRVLALGGGENPSLLEDRPRRGEPPVLVRVKEDRVLVDLRTVPPSADALLREALATALGAGSARRAA
jgi:L-seryl-tRNA(Ser) seleniumtransferase